MRKFFVVSVLTMVILACGDESSGADPVIAIEPGQRACTAAADCVATYEGKVCITCGCVNTAIAKSAQTAYSARHSELAKQCPPREENVYCGACQQTYVACSAGTCRLLEGSPPVDAGAD
jgi:hypothetical protein